MEELIFGGAYVQREICISKLIRLAYTCSWKEIYHFCFVLLCIRGQFPSTGPEGVISGGGIKIMEGFVRYKFGGLIFGGASFWNFTVCYQTYPEARSPA